MQVQTFKPCWKWNQKVFGNVKYLTESMDLKKYIYFFVSVDLCFIDYFLFLLLVFRVQLPKKCLTLFSMEALGKQGSVAGPAHVVLYPDRLQNNMGKLLQLSW